MFACKGFSPRSGINVLDDPPCLHDLSLGSSPKSRAAYQDDVSEAMKDKYVKLKKDAIEERFEKRIHRIQ